MPPLCPVVCVLALATAPAPAAGDQKPDRLAALLAKMGQRVRLDADPDSLPLRDIVAYLEKNHDIKIVVREDAFRAAGEPAILDKKPTFQQRVTGLPVRKALDLVLGSTEASYLVRRDMIEIVPRSTPGGDSRPAVSAVFKDKPLTEAVAELAEEYDATVVVAPQAGDARTTAVSARLLNVPLETALELLAVQADLRVVRRKNAFLITTADAASAIHEEDLHLERQKAELRQIKSGTSAKAPPTESVPPTDANK